MIDISKIFKPRNMRRGLLLALLFAPLVYLFGTQFSALNGAHGEEILGGTVTVERSYDELMEADNFSYGAFDWTNEYGTRVGFSLGEASLRDGNTYGANMYLNAGLYGVMVNADDVEGYFTNFGLGFYGEYFDTYIAFYNDYGFITIDEVYFDDDVPYDCYTCFYIVPFDISATDVVTAVVILFDVDGWIYSVFYFGHNSNGWFSVSDLDWYGWGDSNFYFDDGAHLPEGVEWNDELRSYFVPTVKTVETSNYNAVLFGNFFAPNNWVSTLGRQVIQGDVIGFEPVAQLIRFGDENMLHISDTPWGDLAYGYAYYAINVFILYELVALSMFVIALPFKIIDMFENKTGGID